MQPEIRRANESDAIQLADFMNQINNEQVPYILPFNFIFSPEIQLSYIKRFTETKNACLLLHIIDHEIVGALDFMPYSLIYKQHSARVGLLVKKDNRGLGIGSSLLKSAIEIAAKTDLIKIEAEIFTQNHISLSLFLKYKFKIEGYINKSYLINGHLIDVINLSRLL